MNGKYYITTPIYYPSGNWHIGHCYTTVVCDAFARYHKMLGEDVFFLTGTDEHGQKIEKKAEEAGVTPKAFVDPLVAELKEIWKALDINYSKFIRTTDEEHVKAVQYARPASPFGRRRSSKTANVPIAAGKWRWKRKKVISSAFPNTPTRS